MANSKGRLIHSDGDCYEGDWVYNKQEGQGIYWYMMAQFMKEIGFKINRMEKELRNDQIEENMIKYFKFEDGKLIKRIIQWK